MSAEKKKLVKCLVCGAVFEEGVQVCPVCNVGPENFVPYEEEVKSYHHDTEELYLILGNGIAGLSAAEAIRERNSTCSIVLATDEPYYTYSRPMLTKSLMGENGADHLMLHDQAWYEEQKILTLTGRNVQRIDPVQRYVFFEDGIKLNYDKCIYALGSSCFIPPIKGHEQPEVIAIRNLQDAEKIASMLPAVKQAVVIGGGVLGLEAAWELQKAGCEVTVLELAPQLMGRQLDAEAGEFLKQVILDKGIKIHLNVQIEEIEGDGSVTGVRLGDGTVLPAQLVIVSAGVRANTAPAQTAGIELGRAVKVNSRMETSVSRIYACGDCAEYGGINYAIWPQAVEMGKAAGANAAGDDVEYHTVAAALTFAGMDTSLYAIGDVGKTPGKVYEINRVSEPENGIYEVTYHADGKLCGAVLIGDTSKMQQLAGELA